MLRMLRLLLVALFLWPGPAMAESAWPVIEPEGLGFRISMPVQPSVSAQTAQLADGSTLKTFSHSSKTPAAQYAAAITEFPLGATPTTAADVEKGLDESRDALVQSFGGSLASETKINFKGRPGREFVANIEGGVVYRGRIYLSGRRLYQLGVLTKRGAEGSSETEQFLSSFDLTEPVSGPDPLSKGH